MDTKPALLLVACLIFCTAYKGNGDASGAACRASDLIVVDTDIQAADPGQRPTAYFVSVVNTCACAQKNIKLACPGYNSSIQAYPASAISPDGDGMLCTLAGGGPVESDRAIDFYYESSTKFSFEPVSSTVVCYDNSTNK
ncbi:unnamed protein product [Alopecurus aequalis]